MRITDNEILEAIATFTRETFLLMFLFFYWIDDVIWKSEEVLKKILIEVISSYMIIEF